MPGIAFAVPGCKGVRVKLLLIGPPGSGMGTQGERLAQHFGIEHIAAGDLLRAEVKAQTPLGQQAERIMQRGDLVPDEIIIELILPRVLAAAEDRGYVLDGFPRSVPQALEARKLAEQEGSASQAAIYLDVPRDELMRRILGRAAAEGRADDNEETVANRLRVFDEATEPLVDFYRGRGLLHVIDAAQPEQAVTSDILEAVGAGES